MSGVPKFSSHEEYVAFVDEFAKRNTVSMDNRDWFFCVSLTNGEQTQLFTKSGIETLVIEDELFQWYTSGYIVLRNDENALERASGPDSFLASFGLSETYKIRGDGRDMLTVNITPKLTTVRSFLDKVSGMIPQPDEDIYKLSNDYVIYDTKTETINGVQFKTLYFWDLRYHLLLERNIHYSTALVKCKKDKEFAKIVRQVNNTDREIYTGEAIQEFLIQSLEDIAPEFEDSLWDKGDTKTFYSSPAQYKGINDIDWLMSSHISNAGADNDFGILKYDYYIKKWTLIPISDYFERALEGNEAGEYQHDKFQVSYHLGPLGPLGKFMSYLFGAKNKAPKISSSDQNAKVQLKDPKYKGTNKRKNITPGEALELERDDWRFTDLAGIDNQTLLTTYAVHSYDMTEHEFNIDVYNSEIQTVAEKFQEKYIENNFLGETTPFLSFLMTKGKKNRKVMNNLFSLNNEEKVRAVKGRNQLYKNLIFLNNACTIDVKGDTHRRSGRFFSIDRVDTYYDNEYDEKMLGQYFNINVKHIFDKDTYRNEIIGVKPYRFNEPEFELEKIIE